MIEVHAIERSERGLPITRFTFPDGLPHIAVDPTISDVMIEASIRNATDLLETLLINNALRANGAGGLHLFLRYLIGDRMDRPIKPDDKGAHPFSLAVIVNVLHSVHWDSISIFDPHSDVSPALLDARPIPPTTFIYKAMRAIQGANGPILVVLPDAGAEKRTIPLLPDLGMPQVTQCVKHRDMQTGQLTGFKLLEPEVFEGRSCLIVDDLCDGGRTFTSIAELALKAGAADVNLYVSHGVFSKGYDLAGITRIFTTDSYCQDANPPDHVTIFPLN